MWSGQVARRTDSRDVERKNDLASKNALLQCAAQTTRCCRPTEWSAASPNESFAEEWCSLKDRDTSKDHVGPFLIKETPEKKSDELVESVEYNKKPSNEFLPAGPLATIAECDGDKTGLDQPAINGVHASDDTLASDQSVDGVTEIALDSAKEELAEPDFDFDLMGQAASLYSSGQRINTGETVLSRFVAKKTPEDTANTTSGRATATSSSAQTANGQSNRAPSQTAQSRSRQPHTSVSISEEQMRTCQVRFHGNMSNVLALAKGSPLQNITVATAVAHYAEIAKKTRGTIARKTFVDATAKLGEQHGVQVNPTTSEAFFDALDIDGTGRLTRAGWSSGVSLFFSSGDGAEADRAVFRQIAKNGEDTLSLQEFEVYITPVVSMAVPRELLDLRNEVKRRMAVVVFESVGQNVDGRLTANNFVQWCDRDSLGACALRCLEEMTSKPASA